MTTKKVTRKCSLTNCDRPHQARGYCRTHYTLLRRRGELSVVREWRPDSCLVSGCDRPMKDGVGVYCSAHYQRLKNYGRLELSDKFNRKCSIEGCDRKHRGMGYCSTHWERFHATGDPLLRMNGIWGDTPEQQFWTRVAVTRDEDQCWEWQRGTEDGYGVLQVQKKTWKAHRYAWFLVTGREPKMCILHSCDNRACVNPKHLREGTPFDNMQDAKTRDRLPRGEKHPYAKLTNTEVEDIRTRLRNGEKVVTIARERGVSKSTIINIRYNRTYVDKSYGPSSHL